MASTFTAFRVVLVFLGVCSTTANCQKPPDCPEQIHLSYGVLPTQMIVTWVTMKATPATVVEYGEKQLDRVTTGEQDEFIDGGDQKRCIYIHRVTISNLRPGQKYFYRCGYDNSWSSNYTFTARQSAGSNWSPRVAVLGDLGKDNAQSVGRLTQETQQGHFDFMMHVGDFAYDFHENNGRAGDEYMNKIQPFTAFVPYMTCPGNHEAEYNFSHYKNRFTMPGDETREKMFYSVDIGAVHMISFSSEFYYFLHFGSQQIVEQYKWLERDLIEANKPENRAQRPWIISMCHRPMYCSNSDDNEHCPNLMGNTIRVGIPGVHNHKYGLEDLLYKYGVDIHFSAHEHAYERMWPVYNLTVCNGSLDEPYRNPRAPVHIVSGSAGCREYVDPFYKIPFPWSAARSDDYGYSRMTVYNATHVHIDQVSDDKEGKVIDKILIIKDKHGAGLYDCHREQKPSLKHLTHLARSVPLE